MKAKDLTKAEMEIMKIIWGYKGLFLAEIIAAIPEPRPAYTTVSTVIRVLVSKGFIKYKQYGKSNRYSAAVSKEEYSQRAIERMQCDLFGGSYSAMLSFFAKPEKLTTEERDELLAMLSENNE